MRFAVESKPSVSAGVHPHRYPSAQFIRYELRCSPNGAGPAGQMPPGLLGGVPAGVEAGISGIPVDGSAAGSGGMRGVVLLGSCSLKSAVFAAFPRMLDDFSDNAAVLRVSVWPAGQREDSQTGGTAGSAAGRRKTAAVCTGGAVFLWLAAVGCAVFPAERIISALDWVFFPLSAGAFLPADRDEAVYGVAGMERQHSLSEQALRRYIQHSKFWISNSGLIE